jgi:hypothetical protein
MTGEAIHKLPRMLDDTALCERVAAAGRQMVTDQFELGGLLDRYARLVESTVRGR